MAILSLCYSLPSILSQSHQHSSSFSPLAPSIFLSKSHREKVPFLSHNSTPFPRKPSTFSFIPKLSISEAETPLADPETVASISETQVLESPVQELLPKREEVFAVVMIGSRQYIVFPGRYIYTQRLKGANVDDKIILNKVLLVGTKTNAYIGKPVVPNAAVHAVVEEQLLDKKVIVFKYKRKKNYRRNIGHRQPITRIKITGITGYENSPIATLP